MRNLMKTCIAVLFSTSLLFAQYTPNDSLLIFTTFHRSFDEKIIDGYITSHDSQKVIAGLLSISHSEDTTWIDKIIQLNFDSYGKYIAFTLGQLGECRQSAAYITQKLNTKTKHIYQLNSELGKFGTFDDLDFLLNKQHDPHGVPTAIYNFSSRDIKHPRSEDYLLSLIDYEKYDDEQIFEALYALYRIGPSEKSLSKLSEVIGTNHGMYRVDQLLYALGSLRKLSSFPDDNALFKHYINHDDWRIKVEAARTLINFPKFTKDLIDQYLKLLNDNNPNVSRAAAQSLRSITLQAELKQYLLSKLKSQIDEGISSNARGEIFQTVCSLDSVNTYEYIDEFEDDVEIKFINNVLLTTIDDPEFNLEFLKDQIPDAGAKEQLSIIPALLVLQSTLIQNDEYNKLLISLLKTDQPAAFSILANGIDSTTVLMNSALIQQLLLEQAIAHVNDAQFAEAMIYLVDLSERIGKAFAQSILEILINSNVFSIHKLAAEKLGEPVKEITSQKLFNEMFPLCFKYSSAEVSTNKGKFALKFLPEFAPISVGNFSSLVLENFYDDVIFHRVVPNFVIQCGDPTSTGWGGPGYEIKSEFSPFPYDEGVVGMASAGKDTEGSQWFVMHGKFPHLNERYSVWGKVTEGMDVVNLIDEGDKILSIKLNE